jgi:hypothetical protein
LYECGGGSNGLLDPIVKGVALVMDRDRPHILFSCIGKYPSLKMSTFRKEVIVGHL